MRSCSLGAVKEQIGDGALAAVVRVPIVALSRTRAGVWLVVGPCAGAVGPGQDREEAETMAATNQICQMDTITLARAVAAKELSPVEAI